MTTAAETNGHMALEYAAHAGAWRSMAAGAFADAKEAVRAARRTQDERQRHWHQETVRRRFREWTVYELERRRADGLARRALGRAIGQTEVE